MKSVSTRALRFGLVCAVLLASAQAVNAQSSDIRGIVVDSNGKIYQANYLCDSIPECTSPLVQLTGETAKAGSVVAIGTITPAMPENYVFISNTGRKGEVLLLVEETVDMVPWAAYSFDSGAGATAMVVARNNGTLFVAREGGIVEAYRRNGTGIQGYNTMAGGATTGFDFSFPVPYGGSTCSDIVGIEEWPINSGDLLIACNAPGGLVKVDMPVGGSTPPADTDFMEVIAPNSLGGSLAAVGVTTVPFVDAGLNPDGAREFALVVVDPSEVLAVPLDTIPVPPGTVQRNVLIGGGQVRDLATGLCFRDPANESDGDQDVDETCLAIVQSGNAGKTAYAELKQAAPGSALLASSIVDTINGALKNTYGVDLVNTGTVPFDDCRAPQTCQVANFEVQSGLQGVPPGEIVSFETQGSFDDPRYNAATGLCDRVELPLDFTGVPVLEDASIGPEFCARNGRFFFDIFSAPGVLPTSGITQYEGPGECWMPGFDTLPGAAPMPPSVPLDFVEYGLLFGDELDLLRNADTIGASREFADTPIQPGETYDGPGGSFVTNRFAQDNLVGCATRLRASGRFTFVIEDFIGNDLDGDLGLNQDPIGDNVLFQYGIREANQRIDIPVLSPQSGCYEALNPSGSLTGACESHVVALNGGLAGWELQRSVGATEIVTSEDLEALGSISGLDETSYELSGDTGDLSGLSLNVMATGGTFDYRRGRVVTAEGAIDVLGISGQTGGEIDRGQVLSLTVSTTPRPGDLVLTGSMGNEPVEVDVPFRAGSLTVALLFDGPEFGDVQEKVQITATLPDAVWQATLTNSFDPDEYTWELESLSGRAIPASLPAPTLDPVGTDDASDSDSAVVRVLNPFGNEALLRLDMTAVDGDCGSGLTCSNQSDFSFLDIGIEAVDRVQALSFAYQNYLRALCSVSSRPDFGAAAPGIGTRPNICTNDTTYLIPADTAAFNEVSDGMGGTVIERNIAGYQQADIEGVLRFIAHNICELDYETLVNPGEVAFTGSERFCSKTPEWVGTIPGPSP